MKRVRGVLAMGVLLAVLAGSAAADVPGRGFGIGVMAGDPAGLNLKWWTTDAHALVLGLGRAFVGFDGGHVHLDKIWHRFKDADLERHPGRWAAYIGGGIRVHFRDSVPWRGSRRRTRAGVRVPMGVTFIPDRVPVEFFGEIAPVLDVAPSVRPRLSGGVGARYYFGQKR